MNQHTPVPLWHLRTLFSTAGGTQHHIPAGETVFSNGEHSDVIYFLLRGRAKLYLVGPAARQVLVALVRPGELLGEAALLADGRRRLTAVALEDAVVLGLPTTTFVRLLHEHGALAAAVTCHLVERLHQAQQQTYQRTVQPVAGRLASWLLEEHRRQGSTGRVALDLRRRDLAELLGMAREMLSALLGRFADRGMVQYSWRQVRLVQLDLLAACAEGRVQVAAR